MVTRFLTTLLASWAATAALAAPGLSPGGHAEFDVELPEALRKMAGRGETSPVSRARVTIAVPAGFDGGGGWPVLVVSATSDPGYNSSRRLLRAYGEAALAGGWIVVAADPAGTDAAMQDEVPLRLAINTAALAVLRKLWPEGGKAPLAFGGFSGGAKYSCWLAAAFAREGRTVIGLYLAGVNEEALVPAATRLGVLDDAFRRIPVFLQSGEGDTVATPADHRRILSELKRAGFTNVRLESIPGPHAVEPGPLRTALAGFRDAAAMAPAGNAPGRARPVPSSRPVALAEGAWLIPGTFPPERQPDGNTLVLRGSEGLIVVDTGRHPSHRSAILELARSEGAPIVAIVNSHWHLDHVSGNPGLKASFPGARVHASDAIDGAIAGFFQDSAAAARKYLASPGVPEEMAEDIRGDLATYADGDALRPEVVIAKSGTMTLAGRRLEVNLARNGPTAGDVWLYDPGTGIVASGDLVTLPVPFLDTACVEGWRNALARIAATPFGLLVPGHGKPMSRAEFARYRAAFENFATCAGSTRPASECAEGWVKDAADLLKANAMDAGRALGMARYYTKDVLRPNAGNSKYCKPGAG
ncbi:MAG: MBL fold metallo-hydrolase [Burkholderiales bacterium]